VTLKHYLYGVVPRESPASWKPEALKAQAVVAHSYAKAEVDPDDDGVRNSASALYCTTSDQVYGGHSRLSQGVVVPHEQVSTNAAVDATLGKLVKYGTTIVQTFFFSASGGHTANIEDSWSYSTPRPYYTGVDDPYEATPHRRTARGRSRGRAWPSRATSRLLRPSQTNLRTTAWRLYPQAQARRCG